MAMVLIILGLIIGGLLLPISTQMDIRSRQETKKTLDSIKEALIGFALTNGRLPCPDFNGDGVEDPRIAPTPAIGSWDVSDVTSAPNEIRRPTLACANATPANVYEGQLPFVSIGVGRHDEWNDLFTYRVSPEFTDTFNVYADTNANGVLDAAELPPTPGISPLRTNVSLSSKGNITIGERGNNPATGAVETKFINAIIGTAAGPSSINASAVIISHGKNQLSGIDAFTAIARPAAPATSDELLNVTVGLNATGVSQKIYRTPTPIPAGACNDTVEASNYCEFDDMVDWIAPSTLLGRMVSAGKLP